MIISFEEKDRQSIESKGITIIEFKRMIYKANKSIAKLWQVLQEIVSKLSKALDIVIERFSEIADSVKLITEQICEALNCPTSRRYRMVKAFSKCTGTNISFGWEITWKIKKWIERRYCWEA